MRGGEGRGWEEVERDGRKKSILGGISGSISGSILGSIL